MKIRVSFAAALLALTAACSGDATSPEPAQIAPAAASQAHSTDAPDLAPAETEDSPASGLVGSSGG